MGSHHYPQDLSFTGGIINGGETGNHLPFSNGEFLGNFLSRKSRFQQVLRWLKEYGLERRIFHRDRVFSSFQEAPYFAQMVLQPFRLKLLPQEVAILLSSETTLFRKMP